MFGLEIMRHMPYSVQDNRQLGNEKQQMAEAAFNTIAEIHRLREAGFEQVQAEAITLSIHAGVTGGVATKADVDLLRQELITVQTKLGGKTESVKTDLEGKIETFKTDLEGMIKTQGESLRREIAETRTELVKQIGDVRTLVETLGKEIALGQVTQLRWMMGSIIALGGVLVAALALT